MTELSNDLRKSNPGAFSVLQSMVNYLFILDFKGQTLLTSQSVLDDTELPLSYFKDKHFRDYLFDNKDNYNILDAFLLNKEVSVIELELRHKNGSKIPVRVLSTTLLKEFFNDEDLIFVLCSDLRPQKKAQAVLVQSNKMASLGEMSSRIAHELNNPLTIMDGQLRRLQDYIVDEEVSNEKCSDLVAKTQHNLMRVLKVINSFRSVSKEEDLAASEKTRISDLVEELKELTQKRLESQNIRFNVLCSDNDILINCVRSSILQVFINLVNNAIDALELIEEKWIKLHIIKKKDNVILTIMDSGEGVSFENQVRLFEPFFTTKDIGKGAGLGLSVARDIVEDHKGTIIYTSKMRHSCFVITLPLYKD